MIRLRKAILALLVAAVLASPLYATNGYFTHGQGTASKGMVGATTAIAQDALDAETNPAASVFLKSGYSFSLALFSPKRAVHGRRESIGRSRNLRPDARKRFE